MIAIVWALSAAVLYGTGAALQQHQAAAAPDRAAGRPGLLLLLMRRPWWLLGIVAEIGGFATHAFALKSGPLTVVQLLLASSLVFSVGTVHLRSGRWPSRATWAAVAAVVAGLGSFVALTAPALAHAHDGSSRSGLAALGLAAAALPFAAIGLFSRDRRRAVLLAIGAGLADTGVAVVTMAFTHSLGHGLGGMLTSWPAYALAIGGPCSLLLTQTAYQAGRPMISLPVITVVSPLASLAVGIGLLGETTKLTVLSATGAGLAVLVAGAGLLSLARTASIPAAAVQPATAPATPPAPGLVPDPEPAPRWRPAILGVMRPLAVHSAHAARLAFGSLAFWAYPAWGTSPYWESIPPAGPAEARPVASPYPHRPPAHTGPLAH
ncbi:MAG: DMT family transporter [Actinobacteria bacterium]|nr:DMT family transporter [Actinomycetota bacterium]